MYRRVIARDAGEPVESGGIGRVSCNVQLAGRPMGMGRRRSGQASVALWRAGRPPPLDSGERVHGDTGVSGEGPLDATEVNHHDRHALGIKRRNYFSA